MSDSSASSAFLSFHLPSIIILPSLHFLSLTSFSLSLSLWGVFFIAISLSQFLPLLLNPHIIPPPSFPHSLFSNTWPAWYTWGTQLSLAYDQAAWCHCHYTNKSVTWQWGEERQARNGGILTESCWLMRMRDRCLPFLVLFYLFSLDATHTQEYGTFTLNLQRIFEALLKVENLWVFNCSNFTTNIMQW